MKADQTTYNIRLVPKHQLSAYSVSAVYCHMFPSFLLTT